MLRIIMWAILLVPLNYLSVLGATFLNGIWVNGGVLTMHFAIALLAALFTLTGILAVLSLRLRALTPPIPLRIVLLYLLNLVALKLVDGATHELQISSNRDAVIGALLVSLPGILLLLLARLLSHVRSDLAMPN